MSCLLVIEDEGVLAKNIKRALEKLGHAVTVAATGAEGERLFADLHPDLTLLDLRLPDMNGLDLLPRLTEQPATGGVLIMTAYATIEDAVQAIKRGARDYLQKPLHMEDLRHAVTRALQETQLQQEVSYYRGRESKGAGLEALVGECAAIEELRAKVRRLCDLPADVAPPTVLIRGETGTGKGLLARILHYNGQRAGYPFLEVNCAAIPENLVEAELFGHERGAFTDAKSANVGLFQAADRGTLFLDEIGGLSAAMQAKILNAIEQKTVRPVGSRSERSVDIQIIAATNSDLETKIRDGSFREDLYYRFRVAPLLVPPLRERGDDLLLLVQRFIGELSTTYRLVPRRLTAAAEERVRMYHWPGNVRELRNTLDHAILFTPAETIDSDALGLPDGKLKPLQLSLEDEDGFNIEIPDGGIRFEALERALMVSALRKAAGSQSAAARLLGISRDTLRYRMEKFRIEAKTT